MKLRLKIRYRMQPSNHTIGWRKGRPIIRLTKAQLTIAEMLGIPTHVYAKQLLKLRLGGAI